MTGTDRTIRVLLAAVAFLLGANLLVQLGSSPRTAMAQGIPDSGAQAQAQINLLKDLNGRIDKLQAFLESGKLTVKVEEKPAK